VFVDRCSSESELSNTTRPYSTSLLDFVEADTGGDTSSAVRGCENFLLTWLHRRNMAFSHRAGPPARTLLQLPVLPRSAASKVTTGTHGLRDLRGSELCASAILGLAARYFLASPSRAAASQR